MLPRLPLVDSKEEFFAFSNAGRQLAELHLNYETIEPYRKCEIEFAPFTNKGDSMNYRVEKMRFGKIDSKTADKSVIYYNTSIAIKNIPSEAYEYVVNGKSAIEWIMERYQVTTDTKSGITNDPNDWAKEHDDEKYIYNLLLRIINVSVQTVEIVKSLPKLKFE
jgi:predicted helicase